MHDTKRFRRRLVAIGFAAAALGYAVAAEASDFTTVGLYQSVSEMQSWAGSFASTNSDIVQEVTFGYSMLNQPLIALKISVNPTINDPGKPEFLFTGGVHARECVGSQAAYLLAEHLVAGYRAGSPAAIDALSEREVWIVPNLNPDGRLLVESGSSAQRTNIQGVDLNRNFPHRWADASSDPGTDTYRGPSVLSTPEDSSLWSLLHNTQYFSDLRASIDFHSGAANVLAPWVSPSDRAANPLPADDRAKFDVLSARLAQITGLSTSLLWYDSYGTQSDSLYEEFDSYSLTEELYTGPSNGYFQLFNPVDQTTLNAVMNKALGSADYLLSDEAFLITPEPGSLTLLGLAGLAVLRRRRRTGR